MRKAERNGQCQRTNGEMNHQTNWCIKVFTAPKARISKKNPQKPSEFIMFSRDKPEDFSKHCITFTKFNYTHIKGSFNLTGKIEKEIDRV